MSKFDELKAEYEAAKLSEEGLKEFCTNLTEEDLEEFCDNLSEEELEEFKASFGDPSFVPGPVDKKVKARRGDKLNTVDDPKDSPTAVKPEGKAKPVKEQSKMNMIQTVVELMNNTSKDDIADNMEKVLAAFDKPESKDGEEAATEEQVQFVAPGHKVTVEDIDLEDDVKALFAGDESLSEEFKEKATTIFETAVVTKINESLEQYAVVVDQSLTEEKAALAENIDEYLDRVVEQWLDENRVAVTAGIRSELAESFIGGLKTLFDEHFVEVPEDQVDVVEELAARGDQLEAQLDEATEQVTSLNKELGEYRKQSIFVEVSEGMTVADSEKFEGLAENVVYESDDKYREKLNTLKESYFSADSADDIVDNFDEGQPLAEGVGDGEEPKKEVEPGIQSVADYISRHAKS